MDDSSSVTVWLDQLKLGEPDAAQKIFEAYYAQLVRLAYRKLAAASRRVADEEDVALAAFHSFYRGVQKGRFPQLNNRGDLWQVLVMVMSRKAIDQKQADRRIKRGGGRVRGESAFGKPDEARAGITQVAGREPTPEFAALVAEEFDGLLRRLDDAALREVAMFKLEGHSNEEIAAHQGCGVRTVERKLARIRSIWEKMDPP
jgi:RNA polymerase sigma factor (sigma-70 family)